jgi:hypothetical protein
MIYRIWGSHSGGYEEFSHLGLQWIARQTELFIYSSWGPRDLKLSWNCSLNSWKFMAQWSLFSEFLNNIQWLGCHIKNLRISTEVRYAAETLELELTEVYHSSQSCIVLLTDLINSLAGNKSVNTVQHATIDQAVFLCRPCRVAVKQRGYGSRGKYTSA